MGAERTCRIHLPDGEFEGWAHCGSGEISFRGEKSFRWKWTDLAHIESSNGALTIQRGDIEATLFLGEDAARWHHAILNPKSLIDKLGVKKGMAVTIGAGFDPDFRREVEDRIGCEGTAPFDCAFISLTTNEDLPAVVECRSIIKTSGMIWTVWQKGRKEFGEGHIRNFALLNGLVDVKVVKFSEELSALKLVIPVKLRGG
ncbi:MAG: hypothetical protein KF812_03435 [Fimbriimonadaceae bacterium]|nr:hypothetical protein [Fimbriimonadaceae bacterium]